MIKILQPIKTKNMKKLAKFFLLVVVITMFVIPSKSFAQDGKKNVFKTNLLSPIVGSYNFFYERAIAKKASLQLGVGFVNLNIGASAGSASSSTKMSGYRITPEFRFYPSSNKSAPKGFFVGPYITYQDLTLKVTNSAGVEGKASLTTFGGGLILGYQWLISDIVALDLFAGGGSSSGSVTVDSNSNGFTSNSFASGNFSGGGIRFGFSLGIAF